MEQYVGIIQLVVISAFSYYLIFGSKIKKTWMTWVLALGSVMLAAALAYRLEYSDKPSAVLQIWFQISNILTYGALLAFEYTYSKRVLPKAAPPKVI